MSEFKGKTVLVTGGSRGLGEAVCRKFTAEGCRVVVNYAHGREAAEAVARSIGGTAYGCDISDEAAVETMFREIGSIDILVNNARIDPYKRSAGMRDGEWWDAVMAVNLKGAYLCGKLALEQMKTKRWGRMVHISSIWAYQPPNERMLSYAAAKSAMHALSRGFAGGLGAAVRRHLECARSGIDLTDLCTERLTPEMMQRELDTIPLRRGAPPGEVAEAVFDLAKSGFLTGEVVNLNGGAFMRP